ncbi:hypothetical protein CIK64_14670 [Brevibacterium aurantiacum]|uniref:Uncharacterized protein n=1 Tax=Brevibacterium aurantiacum TaxID=273384 RepID=A0A2A3Z2C5_BREAU|nr:hypothetical protein CIK64_14670 [Brevibacterium aurantiacum]
MTLELVSYVPEGEAAIPPPVPAAKSAFVTEKTVVVLPEPRTMKRLPCESNAMSPLEVLLAFVFVSTEPLNEVVFESLL